MAAETRIDPMHQFQISPLAGNLDGSPFVFTNSALWMLVILALIWLFMLGGMKRELVPGRWQAAVEGVTGFVGSMLSTSVGPEGRKYLPWVFTIFMFILFSNLLGLVPYSFTVTSHIIVTFALAAIVFVGVTIVGIVKHGFHFLRLFVPEGVPVLLLLLLVPIELLSYFIRPFTLSIRLFANMLAGHTMLAIFGGFAASIWLVALFPLAINVALVGLELLVAVLQAYVFAILTCLYLRDALHLH